MKRPCQLALSVVAFPALGAPPAVEPRIADLAFLAGAWVAGLEARVEGDATSSERAEEIRYRSAAAGCR
jgi:hypothetical protein